MSFHRDRDLKTRGVGAIASIDHATPVRRRRRAIKARRELARDRRLANYTFGAQGGIGAINLDERHPQPDPYGQGSHPAGSGGPITGGYRTPVTTVKPPVVVRPPSYEIPHPVMYPPSPPIMPPPLPAPPVPLPTTTTTGGGGGTASGGGGGGGGGGTLPTLPPDPIPPFDPGLPGEPPESSSPDYKKIALIGGGIALAAWLILRNKKRGQ
jgi:hypothetical protein